ncbi:outer dense fiber protein 3-B [Takifugu flavidus]|uniref:outer dense fiber protein 3-B n=1 Tax=Takifugu flavidus TaxID=433684 RepID=UPI0025443A17|nr:outer dense fiber protein 3-B [Takifugu flavidus]
MKSIENWVGTWRPHRPRGPIAALYSSPGPKYALPGLTGSSEHDPTKYKAPMFSMGMRHKLANPSCSPGPKYSMHPKITRKGHDGTPAFSIYKRRKDPRLVQTPGPGAYSPERADRLNFHSAPACSLSGRHKEINSKQTPSPASYTLPPVLGPNTVVTPAALAYSISGRNKSDSDLNKIPLKSPGLVYKVVDPSIYRPKAPQYSMTGRNFPPDDSTKKPGPGAHYPEKVTLSKPKAPSFTFGIRHSQYISSLVVDEFNKRSLTNERDKAATALEPKAAW